METKEFYAVVLSNGNGQECGWVGNAGQMVSYSLCARFETEEQANQAAEIAAKRHNLFAEGIKRWDF